MELELDFFFHYYSPSIHYIIPIWNWSFTVPVLDASVIPVNYIIPIWNWSELNGFLIEAGIIITLFLYGIGANLYSWIFFIYFFYYIIPIWNWSSHSYQFFSNLLIYYIIPIWNWSYFCAISFILSTSYYIIPIWNWSCVFRY